MTVQAFFRRDLGTAVALGSARLRPTLESGTLVERRDRLGPILRCDADLAGSGGELDDPVPGWVRMELTGKSGDTAEVRVDLVYAGAGEWRADAISILPDPPGRPRTARPASDARIERQHCPDCGAIRFRAPGDEWREIGVRSGEGHLWQDGASSVLPDPVPVGRLVFVSRPPFLVGFILRHVVPEGLGSCDYDWAYREDGGTSLDPSDPAVRTGWTADSRHLDVTGVRLDWDATSPSDVCLHYARQAGESLANQDPRICVTTLDSFAKAEAVDPRWVFRGSPSDEGSVLPAAPK
jgi:hypothetical protein